MYGLKPHIFKQMLKIQTNEMYLLEKFLSRPISSTSLVIFVIIVALIIFRFKRRLRSLSTASSTFTFGLVWIQFRNDINNSPMQQAKVQRMQTWTCFIRSVSIFNVWKYVQVLLIVSAIIHLNLINWEEN